MIDIALQLSKKRLKYDPLLHALTDMDGPSCPSGYRGGVYKIVSIPLRVALGQLPLTGCPIQVATN